MYIGLKHAHSGLAYLLLAGLVLAILMVFVASRKGKSYANGGKRWGLIGLILAHLQLVIGLVLYFVSPIGFNNLSGEAMGNAMVRLYTIEHPLTMIFGIVLITIGYAKAKRATNDKKSYNSILLFYILGLILILLRIPWHVWPGM